MPSVRDGIERDFLPGILGLEGITLDPHESAFVFNPSGEDLSKKTNNRDKKIIFELVQDLSLSAVMYNLAEYARGSMAKFGSGSQGLNIQVIHKKYNYLKDLLQEGYGIVCDIERLMVEEKRKMREIEELKKIK